MLNLQVLRCFVTERLNAAVEDIFVQFERTFAEYEEEFCRLKAAKKDKPLLPSVTLNPRVLLHKVAIDESPSLDSNLDLNKEIPPEIKQEEPKKLTVKQNDKEQLHAHVPASNVCVKTENGASLFLQSPTIKTEAEQRKMEPEDIDDDYVQTQNITTLADAQNSHLFFPKYKPETDEDTQFILCDVNENQAEMTMTTIRATNKDDPDCDENHMEAQENINLAKDTYRDGLNYLEKRAIVKNEERTEITDEAVKGQPCYFCTKTFKGKSLLQIHMRTHTGEKPYSCTMCKKTFSQKSNLNNHMRTHTGEKPYSCPCCDKTFSQKSNLKKHFILHTGEKPHSCPFCERSFNQKCNLKSHMMTHRK